MRLPLAVGTVAQNPPREAEKHPFERRRLEAHLAQTIAETREESGSEIRAIGGNGQCLGVDCMGLRIGRDQRGAVLGRGRDDMEEALAQIGLERLGRAFGDDAALVDDADAVRGLDLFDVMRGGQKRQPARRCSSR